MIPLRGNTIGEFFLVFSVIYYLLFCLYVATNFFVIFVFCPEVTCLSNVRHKPKISSALHILILNCFLRADNMCSMNHETKSTAAVYSARNATVATAILGKLWHPSTTVQFYAVLFGC